MKRVIVFHIVGIFVLAAAGFSWAMPHCGMEMPAAQAKGIKESADTAQKAVNVGNKICPVSQEAVDEKLKAIYEYEGKIYNFCCAMCIDDFKKDPQKYIKKIEEEKQKEGGVK